MVGEDTPRSCKWKIHIEVFCRQKCKRELFHEESGIGRYGDMCLGKSMRWPALAYLWDVGDIVD